MPLKLLAPGDPSNRSKVYRVRGTHKGVYIDRTTREGSRPQAQKVLSAIRDEIDRGGVPGRAGLTFTEAAEAYEAAGGDMRFLAPLLDHFGDMPVADIDQASVDLASTAIYPVAAAATRNRQVYTPVCAILNHNDVPTRIKRPRGAQGQRRTLWLRPEQFEKVVKAANAIDGELAVLMILLGYTGLRLSEALGLKCGDIDLEAGETVIGRTKNDDPRLVHLPPRALAALANHPRGLSRGPKRVFRFTKNGVLNGMAREAYQAAKVECGTAPFHILRHTWATWMARGGADLVATRAWRSQTSARVYQHFVQHEEAKKADRLPGAEEQDDIKIRAKSVREKANR